MLTSSPIAIGGSARCAGAPCGSVLRIVIDPAASVVMHLAVGPRHGAGHLVPYGFVSVTDDGVELTCTRAEFDACPPDQDQELLAGTDEAFARMTPDHSMMGVGILAAYGEIAPTGVTRPFPGPHPGPETRTFDRVPDGEEELKPGEGVTAQDGSVGRVRGVAVDPASRRLTHLLVDAGHLWRKRQIAIPVSHIEHIGMTVHISLTKQQIDDLDPS